LNLGTAATQAARDYGALPDAEAVRMARSGEGAGRMPLSAEILERLLPKKDEAPQPSPDGEGRDWGWGAGLQCIRLQEPTELDGQPGAGCF